MRANRVEVFFSKICYSDGSYRINLGKQILKSPIDCNKPSTISFYFSPSGYKHFCFLEIFDYVKDPCRGSSLRIFNKRIFYKMNKETLVEG